MTNKQFLSAILMLVVSVALMSVVFNRVILKHSEIVTPIEAVSDMLFPCSDGIWQKVGTRCPDKQDSAPVKVKVKPRAAAGSLSATSGQIQWNGQNNVFGGFSCNELNCISGSGGIYANFALCGQTTFVGFQCVSMDGTTWTRTKDGWEIFIK